MKKNTAEARGSDPDYYNAAGGGKCLGRAFNGMPIVPPHAVREHMADSECTAACEEIFYCSAFTYDSRARRCLLYFDDFARALEETPDRFTLADDGLCFAKMGGWTHVEAVRPARCQAFMALYCVHARSTTSCENLALTTVPT